MTLAEVIREIESRDRVRKVNQQERAVFDYTLANLIGRSIARTRSSSITMPTLQEAYPMVFEAEVETEHIQERRDELSALRFRLFTQSYNRKYKEGEN